MNNLADLILSGIGASLLTGASSVFIWWRQSKVTPVRTRQVKDAWQAQSKELRDQLSASYEGQIAYLKDELRRERERRND